MFSEHTVVKRNQIIKKKASLAFSGAGEISMNVIIGLYLMDNKNIKDEKNVSIHFCALTVWLFTNNAMIKYWHITFKSLFRG